MEKTQKRFRGLFVPHVTPFDDTGALDLQSLERFTAHLASRKGVAGLAVPAEEQKKLLESYRKIMAPPEEAKVADLQTSRLAR